MKVCSIGCGRHAAAMHGPSWRKLQQTRGDVTLAACCDLNEELARRFRTEFGYARHYTDMEQMLQAEKPDLVSLVVTERLTASLAGLLLEQGYPLILEKPPGRTREETARLIGIAQRTGVPHRVAFNRRHAPLTRKLKDAIAAASPQGVHSIRYDMFRVGRLDPDFSTTAIHGIDLVRHLAASDYDRVTFDYLELPEIGPGVAEVRMCCTFQSGVRATLHVHPVTGMAVERAVVCAADRTFEVTYLLSAVERTGGRYVHYERGRLVEETTGAACGDGEAWFETFGFYHENAVFVEELASGSESWRSGSLVSALQSVELAEAMRLRKTEYVAQAQG